VTDAGTSLSHMSTDRTKEEREEIIRRFSELFFDEYDTTVFANRFLGVRTAQNPLDVWITQEIITEVQPEVIIEVGSWRGGSAALWATILEQVSPDGRVVAVDLEDNIAADRLEIFRRRVDFVQGSSIDPAVVEKVDALVGGRPALVILDSDHSYAHVAAELRCYAHFVPVGGYLICQDTFATGHPLPLSPPPGAWDAVVEFVEADERFEIDLSRERLLLTCNPNGFLRRVR
jgi:cephalosporin hydroxylase